MTPQTRAALALLIVAGAGEASVQARSVPDVAPAAAQGAPCIRLSWHQCDPQRECVFYRAGVLNLIQSVTGLSSPIVGHDTSIRVARWWNYPGLPDAWRFDEGGCQGSSMIAYTNDAASQACPAMVGANAVSSTSYMYDPGIGSAIMHLGVSHDAFSPAPATRYTMWQVTFDHTYTVVGPADPAEACGGGEYEVYLELESARIHEAGGAASDLTTCVGDRPVVTWNARYGSCADHDPWPIPVLPTTLGRVKTLYR